MDTDLQLTPHYVLFKGEGTDDLEVMIEFETDEYQGKKYPVSAVKKVRTKSGEWVEVYDPVTYPSMMAYWKSFQAEQEEDRAETIQHRRAA